MFNITENNNQVSHNLKKTQKKKVTKTQSFGHYNEF